MKILPQHENLRSLVYGLISFQGFIIFFFSYWIAYSFRAQILWLLIALLFLLTPSASQKSTITATISNTNSIKRLSFLKCLGLTFALQITLMLAFYTICNTTEYSMLIGPVPFSLFQITTLTLLTNWGAFPWGVYALLAVALSYTAYIKRQPGDMSTLISPIVKNTAADTISLIADVATKVSITLVLAGTLALMAIQCTSLLASLFHLSLAYGIRSDVLITLLVILKWNQANPLERPIGWLLEKGVSNFWLISGLLLLAIICLGVISFLIGWASPIFTPLLSRIIYFSPNDWAFIWITFISLWWLAWAPLAAGMLAYIWQGYSLRVMVFYTLLLPVTISLLLMKHAEWLNFHLNNHFWNFVPAIVSIIAIILLFLRQQHIVYLSKATLPINERPYHRSPKLFLTRLFQGIIIIMTLYWAGGAYLLGMIYFLAIFLTGLFTMIAGIALFKTILKDA